MSLSSAVTVTSGWCRAVVGEHVHLPNKQPQRGAREGISPLLETVVGNWLLREREGWNPWAELFFSVLVQGCVWPGMALGSPPIPFPARFSLAQRHSRPYLHRWQLKTALF